MANAKKTKTNPHGLTIKQRAVINDMVNDVVTGKGLNPAESHQKIYNPSNNKTKYTLANKNINKDNFREALLAGLRKNRIVGRNGKVEQRLTEGLDATKMYAKKVLPDFQARLSYIQEINKITGVYAPDKKDVRRLSLNLDLTPEQMQDKIDKLQSELSVKY